MRAVKTIVHVPKTVWIHVDGNGARCGVTHETEADRDACYAHEGAASLLEVGEYQALKAAEAAKVAAQRAEEKARVALERKAAEEKARKDRETAVAEFEARAAAAQKEREARVTELAARGLVDEVEVPPLS